MNQFTITDEQIDALVHKLASMQHEFGFDQNEAIIAAHVRAAGTPVPSTHAVVRKVLRPVVTTPSTLTAPIDGMYAIKTMHDGKPIVSFGNVSLPAGYSFHGNVAAIMLLDTESVSTWQKRAPSTTTPREWRAEDVPDGSLIAYEPQSEGWNPAHKAVPRSIVASMLNHTHAPFLLVLPSDVEGAR